LKHPVSRVGEAPEENGLASDGGRERSCQSSGTIQYRHSRLPDGAGQNSACAICCVSLGSMEVKAIVRGVSKNDIENTFSRNPTASDGDPFPSIASSIWAAPTMTNALGAATLSVAA
jgi:hypothetical protein